jgi:hypothetical protein
MKGINTPQGKPWKAEALPPFPPQGAGYLTLLSRHSLGKWNQHTASVPLASLGNQTIQTAGGHYPIWRKKKWAIYNL